MGSEDGPAGVEPIGAGLDQGGVGRRLLSWDAGGFGRPGWLLGGGLGPNEKRGRGRGGGKENEQQKNQNSKEKKGKYIMK